MNQTTEISRLYQAKIEQFQKRIHDLSRLELGFSIVRLIVFLIMLISIVAWFRGDVASIFWPAAATVLFLLLFQLYRRFMMAIHEWKLGAAFYRGGLARLEHAWAGKGMRGAHYLADGAAEARHPYAADLDLFGKGSLFELLCLAATRSGQDTIAGWLLQGAAPEEIRMRQEAVRELAPRLEERERLYGIMRDTPRILETELLAQWGSATPQRYRAWERLAAMVLSAVCLVAFTGWLNGNWPLTVFLLPLAAHIVFYRKQLARRVNASLAMCEHIDRDLMMLVRFFDFIEAARFTAPRMLELQAQCLREGRRASTQIRRLSRLVRWLNDGRYNKAIVPLTALLFWSLHFAVAIERWRRENGGAVAGWIHAAGQFEAYASLACFAYENPSYAWPELSEPGKGIEAEGLGHPLIAAPQRVINDLRLDGELRFLVVSGSNMSGKSTWLRTVGINMVLAQAGAPVCARRMRLSPFNLYALIRKSDSLTQGFSRFYREIMRIHEAIELAGQGQPLLFLIDEIFDGTNSHDRRIAAQAIVRTLLARGAFGLITTHDLALTELAGQPGSQSANMHFEDQLEDGRLSFDYRLREGAVQRGNALQLMRSIGLDV